MNLRYAFERLAKPLKPLLARRVTLCYVRVRCPCCGMWARLDNVKRDQPLFEESTCYSSGDKGLFHKKVVNPSLRAFWINRLKLVLQRLGTEILYDYGLDVPYRYVPSRVYGVEKEVSYAYER